MRAEMLRAEMLHRTVSGGVVDPSNYTNHALFADDSSFPDSAANDHDDEADDAAGQSDAGQHLRRGRRARRPPGSFKLEDAPTTPRVQHRRPGQIGGGAGKLSSAAAAKAAKGGGVRKRPSGSMTVEDRVLGIFGEETLRLDRDAFKLWRGATELPVLTSSEHVALKRLRRRLLGRTYAKRSRDRQVAHASAVEDECDILVAENAAIRKRIAKLQQVLDADERF
jgi:hypothetical protein